MDACLSGKRVLLVAPRYFGYDSEIKSELERRGASVDQVLDRPFRSPMLKALTTYARTLVMPLANAYYRKSVSTSAAYDYVFVVNGQTLSLETLQQWRQSFPDATFVLYMWDSFGNRVSVVGLLNSFDAAFTFDPLDAERYGIQFRPLFFGAGFAPTQHEQDIELSFVGTCHTDRYSVVKQIVNALPGKRLYIYLYLQARWVYWWARLFTRRFTGAQRSDFRFDPIAKAEVQEVFARSRVILDIEHPRQVGLTIRTLETLGAGKKLITTNTAVVAYDFYNPANICVIDRSAPKVPQAFWNTPYEPPTESLYEHYSIRGWMAQILRGASRG